MNLRVVLAPLFVVLIGVAPYAGAGPPVSVILLSWDGVRWDYPDRGTFPGLERLESDGLRAEKLIAGWPSSTFPGHVSMATGAWADAHGIVDNRFWDRERGLFDYSADASWIEAEPLWIAAERQGVRSAAYFWVGSETDWRGQRATYRVTPFDNSVDEAVKVDQIFAWLDLPETLRPRLIMSYWRGADRIGHDEGPDSAAVVSELAEQDVQLVRLLEGLDRRGLWATTTLLLVSDHGMSEVGDFFDLAAYLEAREIEGRIASGGPLVHVYLTDASRAGELAAALDAEPSLRAFRAADVPEAMHLRHPTRTGDVVVLAAPPWVIDSIPWYQRWLYQGLRACCGFARATHGYDPDLPEMGGVLLALGRGVAHGVRAPAARQIDIAPTVTNLLGIDPPANASGRALSLDAGTDTAARRKVPSASRP